MSAPIPTCLPACLRACHPAGRLRSDNAFYTVMPSGQVAVYAPPPELSALMMPEALVTLLMQSSAAKAAAAKEQQQQQQQQQHHAQDKHRGVPQQPPQQPPMPNAGGMRMGLSKEVRKRLHWRTLRPVLVLQLLGLSNSSLAAQLILAM